MPGNNQKWLLNLILGGKTRRERQNLSTNNGEMAKKAKNSVSELVTGESETFM